MPRVIKLLVKKINPEPTINDMKEFGLQYDKTEWYILCKSKEFIEAVDKNLAKARKIANEILNKNVTN